MEENNLSLAPSLSMVSDVNFEAYFRPNGMKSEHNGSELPSRFQIGDEVTVQFQWNNWLQHAVVAGVKFTDYGKVLYDIKAPFQQSNYPDGETYTAYTTLHEVDSCFVEPRVAG